MRSRLGRRLVVGALVAAAAYLALCVAAYVLQRRLIYFPTTARVAPAAAGLPQFQVVALASGEERIVGWWRPPPQAGAGVVLYLHGNGGNLADRADRLRDLAAAGFGVLAIDYRGYGGSTGEPSEAGLRQDALAAYDFARAQGPGSRIAVVGESLGSGVATRLATERPVAGLLFDSPFTSMARMTRLRAPILPGTLLLRDRYLSEERIDDVNAPLLILHCDRDIAIPISEGRRLFAAAREPKRFVTVPGCGHVETWRADTRPLILETLRGWLRQVPHPQSGGGGPA